VSVAKNASAGSPPASSRATATLRAAFSSGARRLLGPAGQALGAVAVVQDITERRLAEQELEHVHKQLLVASRQAGMAEVATNVLHNVGNVLNSVNVSASLVSERIAKSRCTRLGQVASLLAEHAGGLASFLAGVHSERPLLTNILNSSPGCWNSRPKSSVDSSRTLKSLCSDTRFLSGRREGAVGENLQPPRHNN